MGEPKHTFKKEGVNIVLKTHIDDDVLTPKDIVVMVEQMKENIVNIENSITQLKQNLSNQEQNKELTTKRLKKIDKFYDDAKKIQVSKAKNYAKDYYSECKEAVEKEYNYDPTMDERANNLQKFALFQRKLGTHKVVAEHLAPAIIKEFYFNKPVMENPWIKEK
jgi:phosphotransferase system IIB component